jgi:hypothetical protein
VILWIEFIDGSEKEIHVDDVYEGKQCLKYMILYGATSGEYSVPYSQIKTYKITRL